MYPQPVSNSVPAFADPLTRSIFCTTAYVAPTDIQTIVRGAFAEVNGFQPEALQQASRLHIKVYNAAIKGMQYAMMHPQFAALPQEKQRAAAIQLIQLGQQAYATVNALDSALSNGPTMGCQILANASLVPAMPNGNVFNQIVTAHLPPTTQINSMSVMQDGRLYEAPQRSH